MSHRPRQLRVLRIAISAVCGLLCAFLIALWVRSYHTADRLHGRIWFPQSFLIASKEGKVTVIVLRWHGAENWWRWAVVSYPVDDELSFPAFDYRTRLGFAWLRDPTYMVMRSQQTLPDGTTISLFGAATATLRGAGPVVPYWFLVAVCLAAVLLVNGKAMLRFSLRSLLIAATIIAILLGLTVVLGARQ